MYYGKTNLSFDLKTTESFDEGHAYIIVKL